LLPHCGETQEKDSLEQYFSTGHGQSVRQEAQFSPDSQASFPQTGVCSTKLGFSSGIKIGSNKKLATATAARETIINKFFLFFSCCEMINLSLSYIIRGLLIYVNKDQQKFLQQYY